MENIDMEAIARKFGIWRWQDRKCPNCNEDYSAVFKSNYCIMYGCGAELLPAINVAPNFRDPEWLVRLYTYVLQNGHQVVNSRHDKIFRTAIWSISKDGYGFILHKTADNWIDAFLLAVTKLAKEG